MQKFAVFDIDGTLIRWQLYHIIVDRLAKQGALGKNVHSELHKARMRWKRREPTYSFSQYEAVLIQAYETALTNIPTATFDALVNEVIFEYKDQAYTYTRELIRTLKQRNYFLLAISGSHEELVASIAKHYQFDAYAGSVYERTADRFSGEKFVASFNKKAILEQFIQEHNLTIKESYAIGDSKSDVPMLEMTENPIAFNPDQSLFEIATKNHWPIVVERKNVVYELKYSHGKYVLAKAGE